jgi:hypothetical protein
MKLLSITTVVLSAAVAFAQAPANDNAPKTMHEPPPMGIHWAKGSPEAQQAIQAAKAASTRTGNMIWHNGAIMTGSITQAIFWGTKWTPTNTSFIRDKITGLDSWYSGFGGSNYAKTNTEYTGTNGTVGTSSSYLGHVVDTSTASGGGSTTAIQNEVCKIVGTSAKTNGYYAVYTDLPRGNAGYCAWHSYGTCSGTPVQFAFFWNLDGDAGCDPGDTTTGHSQGLAALANVSGHELSEAVTDPRNGGWYDRSGAENGDKCAWTFNVASVTFSNSSKWKIQGEWSNRAFSAGTGYPNNSGQRGCLDGH